MVHLLCLLIHASGLLLLHGVVHAKELPDLTLLRDDTNLYCILKNDTSGIASAGKAGDTPNGTLTWQNLNGDIPRCSITKCVGWQQSNFVQRAVTKLQIKPLLNFFWDELGLVPVKYSKKDNKVNNYNAPSGSWFLEVSVLGNKDVYFNISSENDINPYYWVILGGWGNTGSAIRVPDGYGGWLLVSQHGGGILDENVWLHFRLSWDKVTSEFQVIRWGYNGDQPFLRCRIISPKDMKIYTTIWGATSLLRLHIYQVWSAGDGEARFETQDIISKSEKLCFIVTYNIQSIGKKLLVNVNNHLVHTLEKVGDSWQDERIVVNLDQLVPNWKEESLRIMLRTTPEEGTVYIAGVQECNPQGDTRILKVGLPRNKGEKLYCNLVRYNQSHAVGNAQTKKDCGDTCTLTCMDYISSLSTCEDVILCKASSNGRTSCFCSPGYKGENCNYRICSPIFKNEVKCLYSTVNSMTVSAPTEDYKWCRNKDVEPTQYRLEYRDSNFGVQQKWKTSSAHMFGAKNITVEGLHYGTLYEIRAVAGDEYGIFYDSGDIPEVYCFTTCTDPYVEAKSNESSITLTLKERDNYTCRLMYYLVCNGWRLDVDLSQPVFIINDLLPFAPYTYQLWWDHTLIEEGTVNTTEAAPGPPKLLHVNSKSSTNITICWDKPNQIDGILRAFIVEVTFVSTKLKKKIGASEDSHWTYSLTVNKIQPRYCYTIKDLSPSTSYRVSVCGQTIKTGPCESLRVETPLAVPDINPDIHVVNDTITSTSFNVYLPAAYPYLTEPSAYFLILSSEDDNQEPQKEPDAARMSDFKENLLAAAHLSANQSWIIDELQLSEQGTKYIIGEEKVTNGTLLQETLRNRPLQPGASYNITLVLLYKDGEAYRYVTSRVPTTVRTLTTQSNASMNNGSSSVWLVLLFLIVLLPIAYFIYRRKKAHELKSSDTLELHVEDFQLSPEEEAEICLEDSPPVLQLGPSQKLSRRVAISELESYVKTGLASGEFQCQHSLFPRGQTKPWTYGKKPQNTTKNRYGNLVAYDETRVKLKKLPNDEFSDYINANYIDGYNSTKCYIATQGPKANTVDDFWRMIWQEQVHVIAMLTNVVENGKRKCEQYWPELEKEKTFGSISVHHIASEIFADYVFRQMNVTYKGKTRKIHHLHFTSWPDHGVPLYPQSVAMFLKKMLATPPGSGPIVVHCSAGVGRTGTIILADICLRMAAAEGCIDVLHYQQQIREQRANLVDNVEQYRLVHLVLLECLVEEQNNLPFNSKLPSCVDNLFRSGKLQQQFKRLGQLDWQDKALAPPTSAHLEQQALANEHKNRFQHIIPGAKGRVFISRCPPDDASSDYINAVYVDGFRAKNQFIATQFPLECTVQHFWRLIVEKSIGLVIVLNEVDLTDKSVCQFWPQEGGKMNPTSNIMVIHRQQQDYKDWILHKLSVTDSTKQSLKLLQVKGWPASTNVLPSPELLLKLWQESERLYMGKAPILISCYDGATACGLFLALTFMIEKIKLEQQCDPYHAVRTIRQNRSCFVPTLEQFCFLYDAAVKYLDDFETYANFQ